MVVDTTISDPSPEFLRYDLGKALGKVPVSSTGIGQCTPPKHDGDVYYILLTQYQDYELARTLYGLYRCYRMSGGSVLDSWERCLLAHVKAHEGKP